MAPLITLTTDFGTSDPYAGAMKGVILSINPGATIVDISHDVQPQAILQGAFIIGASHGFFPPGTVHVVVVDPGVGTSRYPLLLVTPRASYLAPDNGVLRWVIREGFSREPEVQEGSQVALPEEYKAYRLTSSEFWRHPVSSTFHGRDIFAPVAAHFSLGVLPKQLGQEIDRVAWLPHQEPQRDGDTLEGQVVHVDRFGNLITDIPASLLPLGNPVTIEVSGHQITGLSNSYAEGNWLLAIVGSYDTLEVSVKNGSASQSLAAGVGDSVTVKATPLGRPPSS